MTGNPTLISNTTTPQKAGIRDKTSGALRRDRMPLVSASMTQVRAKLETSRTNHRDNCSWNTEEY